MKLRWKLWLEDEKIRKDDFSILLRSKKIKKIGVDAHLIKGHMAKAYHNLNFSKQTIDDGEYNDWAIVSAYYAIYHASLALISTRGYSSKDHNATLLLIIKEFYKEGLNQKEIEAIYKSTIEREKVLYYIDVKSKRKEASYSIKNQFSYEEVEEVRQKAIKFILTAREIIDNDGVYL